MRSASASYRVLSPPKQVNLSGKKESLISDQLSDVSF
jgi:hypothetical protein